MRCFFRHVIHVCFPSSQRIWKRKGHEGHLTARWRELHVTIALSSKKLSRTGSPDRWVGRNGPILWPPRIPDLMLLDFSFEARLKNKFILNSSRLEAC